MTDKIIVSRKEIDGLKEDLRELRQQTNVRCAQVQERDITIAEHKAREKVLVEALKGLVGDLSLRAKIGLDDAQGVVACGNGVWIRANEALANVRGEL